MNIQEINELTVEQVKSILLERLEVESASQEELEAGLELYKAELIAEEEARLAEIARIEDLKSRFSALSDSGLIQAQGISNPAAYFRDEILKNLDKAQAEFKMAELESNYQIALNAINANLWLKNRQVEYAKIDTMLMEAIAEKEAGRPEKMDEYLALREQIKLDNPKPE